ncbi:MAG: divalent-cation tolerance protein CutA [Candidatus Methylomirabilales bacterium]
MANHEYIVVLITTSSQEEAGKIGKALVEERLAACINIVPEIQSFFSWQGKLEEEREALMIVKTKASLFPSLVERVKALHSYTVPEIIALPIQIGSEGYLRWIDEVTG